MKTRGNYSILTMVITVFLFSGYTQANQSVQPKRNLQFAISDKPIQWETNELGHILTPSFNRNIRSAWKKASLKLS